MSKRSSILIAVGVIVGSTLTVAPTASAPAGAAATDAVAAVQAASTASVPVVGVAADPANPGANPPTSTTQVKPTPTSVTTTATGVVTGTQGTTSLGLKLPSTTTKTPTGAATAYATTAPPVTTVVTPKPTGYQVAQVIANASAPKAYAYRVKLPTGYSPYLQSNGTIALQKDVDGKAGVKPSAADTIGTIDPAWATDVHGASVPTSYTVAGDIVTQHVQLGTVAASAYPVVADPLVTFGWQIYLYLSNTDLRSAVWTALVGTINQMGGAVCGALYPDWGAMATCFFIVEFFWPQVYGIFQHAIDTNAGIVFKFGYPIPYPFGVSSFNGWMGVGSWS